MTVDVLLPFYGDVAMAKLAVASVLGQTSGDWTLTIVDDGYPDETVPEYFTGVAARDDRITYVRNPSNLGINGNFRHALSFVRNDWAVMMGGDDIMLPDYVAHVLDVAARYPDVQMIHPRVQVIDDDGAVTGGTFADRVKRAVTPRVQGVRLLSGEPLATSLLHGNWLYFPAITWRSEALVGTGFREGYDVVQDLALTLDIVASGGVLALTDHVSFRYRRHSRSLSSWRAVDGTRFTEERTYFEEAARQFDQLGWRKASRAARMHLLSRLNAASLLPTAHRGKERGSARALYRHLLK